MSRLLELVVARNEGGIQRVVGSETKMSYNLAIWSQAPDFFQRFHPLLQVLYVGSVEVALAKSFA